MSLIDGGVTTLWRLGAWSDTTGYPSTCAFHEERLCFAATPTLPNTVWMSVAGDYVNHAPTDLQSRVLDDNAITYTLASGKINAIKWMNSGPTLILGTFGSEYQVRSNDVSQSAITPTNISVTQHTTFGSGNVRPIRIGASVLFVQRSGRKIRELVYDYNTDSLQAKNITIINEHILQKRTKAIGIAYQQESNALVWVVRADGLLAALTYERDQEVYAWHLHQIGGSFQGGNAVVENVACISNATGNEDSLYICVKRTINGITRRYIELLSLEVEPTSSTDKDNYNYLDASASVNLTPDIIGPAIRNGGFETIGAPFSDWLTAVAGTSTATRDTTVYDKDTASCKLSIDLAGSIVFVYQAGVLVVGKSYIVTFRARNNGLGTLQCNDSVGALFSQALTPVFTTYTKIFVATGPNIQFYDNTPNGQLWIDAVKLTLAPQLSAPGFSHLIGETVTLYGDGAAIGTAVVDGSGIITVLSPVSILTAGYHQAAILQTLQPDAGNPLGSAQGKIKKINGFSIKVVDSIGCKYGPSEDKLTDYSFRTLNAQMDNSPLLRTNDVYLPMDGGYDRDASIVITQDRPYPLTILSVTVDVNPAT